LLQFLITQGTSGPQMRRTRNSNPPNPISLQWLDCWGSWGLGSLAVSCATDIFQHAVGFRPQPAHHIYKHWLWLVFC